MSQTDNSVKDVRAKIFQSTDFFLIFFYCSQIMSYFCQKYKTRGTLFRFFFVENNAEFEILEHIYMGVSTVSRRM